MPIIRRLLRRVNLQLLSLSWLALLLIIAVHFIVSWALLIHAREASLIRSDLFWYFYATTATTVGYGDYSPQSVLGRAYTSLWIMPGGIMLSAAMIGKLTQIIIRFWRKGMQGRADYSSLSNHIVILGWHGEQTRYMVNQILGDKKREERAMVLCATQAMDNPMPEQVKYVRDDTLANRGVLLRAAVDKADRIIIHGENDDQTLAAALSVSALGSAGHIVAHFEDSNMAELLKSHCPFIECITHISIEMMVRSSQDPGSSRVQTQLLSTLSGPTQFSIKIPESFSGTTFGKLFYILKEKHQATLFGIAESLTGNDLKMNPPNDTVVKGGQLVYFMAPERLHANEIEWQHLN